MIGDQNGETFKWVLICVFANDLISMGHLNTDFASSNNNSLKLFASQLTTGWSIGENVKDKSGYEYDYFLIMWWDRNLSHWCWCVCVYECGVCECVCVVETVWCRRQYELLLFVFIVLRVFSVKGLFLLKHLLYCQRVHINVLNSYTNDFHDCCMSLHFIRICWSKHFRIASGSPMPQNNQWR